MDNFKPWIEYNHIWKTESMYLSWIRGGIRRYLWSKNPVKLEFVKEARKMIINPNVKLRKGRPKVWGGICEICGKEHILKNMEVDHKTGEHSLKRVSDVQKFVEGIVFVRKEDLAFLCKPCHRIKTLAERSGLSHEDAAIEKQAIIICKRTANEVKSWITQRGGVPARLAKERREQVVKLLKEVEQ
ncbi:putative HNH endonuclease [Pseudomonas phage vB_PsyM_KIL4]|uniref:Putative HNH endonuclease n=2 Tax=Flaumdravirus TaxID=2560133 RepID=A0A142IF36_9CAUD|nr:HNH endonuclease [Pseudomonas phage vB_PsyM_KIL4]AMR57841.1 putative HNH endonuclease [Pseudomonas phage vB_PsyM_KIL4]AMR58010.1 putative HNH endonuclease [Pseudomonas phage vB_PsyM_KIL5]